MAADSLWQCPMPSIVRVSIATMRCSGCATPISTCSWWGAASPARASRSTPPAAVSAPRSSNGTTSRPAPARGARSSCTAGSGTSTSASSAWCTRASPNGSECSRTRRISSACSPSSSPFSRVAVASIVVSPRARQRAVDVRPRRWPAHRQAPPQDQRRRGARPVPHVRPRPAQERVRLLRRARRRRPPHADHRAHRGRVRRGGDELRRGRVVRTARRARRRRADPLGYATRRRFGRDAVVNATGVWADDVRALDEGAHPATIRPAKGVHITLPWERVRNTAAAVVPSAHDNRSVFVIPWEGHTYVGTTDTDYDGPLDDPHVHRRRSRVPPRRAERRHHCEGHECRHRGFVGGPPAPALVGAPRPQRRPLAAPRGARGAERGGHRDRRQAHHIPPYGRRRGRRRGAGARPPRPEIGDQASPALRERRRRSATPPNATTSSAGYGSEAAAIQALVDADPALGEPLVPGLEYLRAEAVYAARHEMAHTLDDVLSRRTRAPRPGARRVDRRGTGRRRSHRARARAGPPTSVSARCATTARPPARSSRDAAAGARRRAQCAHGGHGDHDRDGGTGSARTRRSRAPTTTVPAPTTTTWAPLPAFDTSVEWADCGNGFECGTLTVPVDWRRPTTDTVPLALIRRPAFIARRADRRARPEPGRAGLRRHPVPPFGADRGCPMS